MSATEMLSRLYSNLPEQFAPIDFVDGFNAVLAEIRLPKNRNKDTHNLGKTTLGRLIDFALLRKRDPDFFLFRHEELFNNFVFFLEIKLASGSYLTIRRSVSEHSKISFAKHPDGQRDFVESSRKEWDHYRVPFDRARQLLDGLLDWRGLKPWSYRKGLGYLLRSQGDYHDVFKLARFAGKHSQWKPFLAHVLGFDAGTIEAYYERREELEEGRNQIRQVEAALGGSIEDLSKIEGLLLLKRNEATSRRRLVDAFDFSAEDDSRNRELVESLDEEIVALNQRRYYLSSARKRIEKSMREEAIMFDPESAQAIFEEAGVVFAGQLKRDFSQLIDFNRAITDERRRYLGEELREVEEEIDLLNSRLAELRDRRTEALRFLSDKSVFEKYKAASRDLAAVEADIAIHERQRQFLDKLQVQRSEVRKIGEEIGRLQTLIEEDVERQNSTKDSLFSRIRLYFNEVVEEVIDRKALLSVSPNSEGNLEFRAEILDEAGNSTSADDGHTYKKLLCIAFDLAVLRAHLFEAFPRFVFHDGAFETLDDRKKERLLGVFHRYADLGLQPIVTLIDSDVPVRPDGSPFLQSSEVVLKLHDEGESGRLFRMEAW